MRVHTNGNADTLREALRVAQEVGKVPAHVYFDRFTGHLSRSHLSAYEVHLGTDTKTPGRRRPNGNGNGEFAEWAATYDEWGWFLAALYDRDPEAKVAGAYTDHQNFHERTKYVFA